MSKPNRIFFLSSLASVLATAYAFTYRMSDDAPAAAPVDTPAAAGPVEAVNETATASQADTAAAVAEGAQAASDEAPATVSVEVPAQHLSLIERAVALLKREEQFVIDNIEAGISHFEAMFKE